MPPVRPSALQLAEECDRAPWLGQRYREGNEATRHGDAVDADVSIELVGGGEAKTPEGRGLAAWVRRRFAGPGVKFFVQRKVVLADPVTGETLTEGTPDLLVLIEGPPRQLVVVDWKSKGQLFAGHIEMPANNLQQMAYAVAAGMEFEADEVQIILAFFDKKGIDPIEGKSMPGAEWWPLIERIKQVPHVDVDGPEPLATTGDHCDRCYQKMHCSAYLLPAMKEAPAALVPFSEGGNGLATQEEALAALAWLDQADDVMKKAGKIRALVEDQLKTFVTLNGPLRSGNREWGPIPTNGKRTGPTVAELEDLGLSNLIKPGKPGVKFDWKKVV